MPICYKVDQVGQYSDRQIALTKTDLSRLWYNNDVIETQSSSNN